MVYMPHWPTAPLKPSESGLENVIKLLNALANPHLNLPPTIHIAGTNGKGSTAAYFRAIFESAGYKVHCYTSPHLIDFNERIVLASDMISNDYLFDICERTRIKAEELSIQPKIFEGTTVAAFLAFAEVKADVLILETGMGGRLDPTNVVPAPALTVLTPVSFDHMEYLGPTLPIIAAEKGGIIRPGVPCV
ncbi:MAG: bifunctional folylpolyglutamate synthase/dihydrofolate synthase, partial [Rickettsiaceae bacterium]|nr:bifunctional folylpolyglutamate synthase/dihydrofolate synthase [Rickettsiaceae bacterium]